MAVNARLTCRHCGGIGAHVEGCGSDANLTPIFGPTPWGDHQGATIEKLKRTNVRLRKRLTRQRASTKMWRARCERLGDGVARRRRVEEDLKNVPVSRHNIGSEETALIFCEGERTSATREEEGWRCLSCRRLVAVVL